MPKVVVFGWHVEALNKIVTAFRGGPYRRLHLRERAVLVTGAARTTERADMVRRFQADPAVKVFVGQIQAAGTAITLTASNRVVMHEMAWTPALNLQAMKRCHRIGTKSAVIADVLSVDGSLDHAVNAILTRKTADINMLEQNDAASTTEDA